MIQKVEKDGKQRTILSGTIKAVDNNGVVTLECSGIKKIPDAVSNRARYRDYTEEFKVILPAPAEGASYSDSIGASVTAVCFIPDDGNDEGKDVIYKTVKDGFLPNAGVYNFGDTILVQGWVRNPKQGSFQSGAKQGQPNVSFGIKVGDLQYSIMASNYDAKKTTTTDALWKDIAPATKEAYPDEEGKMVRDLVFATCLVSPATVKNEAGVKVCKGVDTREYNGKEYKFQNCYYNSKFGCNSFKVVTLEDRDQQRNQTAERANMAVAEEPEEVPAAMNSVGPAAQAAAPADFNTGRAYGTYGAAPASHDDYYN